MTISIVAHALGTVTYDGTGTVTYNFNGENVTAGNRIVIFVSRWPGSGVTDLPLATDASKSAGSATIGAFTLDAGADNNFAGTDHIYATVWSVPVTGTGTITIAIAATAGSYSFIVGAEFHSTTGDITIEDNNNVGTGASGDPTTANGTAAGSGLFVGGFATSGGSAITITPDAAFTAIAGQPDGANHQIGGAAYRIVTSGTTDAASWTSPDADPWAAAMCVYTEPGGAAALNVDLSASLGAGVRIIG